MWQLISIINLMAVVLLLPIWLLVVMIECHLILRLWNLFTHHM